MVPNSSGSNGSEQDEAGQSERVGAPLPLQKVPTGISGLDTVLNGGLLRGGIYFVSGLPGTGKTILTNQIAFNHATSGGRTVYVSVLTETHSRMFAHLSEMSFFDQASIGTSLYYISGYGTVQKEGLNGLLRLLQGSIRDNKASLLVVDGTLTAGSFAESDLEFKTFIHKLQSYADAYGCTVVLTNSGDSSASIGERGVGQTTVDGVIRLTNRLVGLRAVRELQVLKLRGSAFMEGVHALDISQNGVQVYRRLEAVLAGTTNVASAVRADRDRLTIGEEKLDKMLGGGLLKGSSTVLLGPPGSGKTLLGLTFLAEGARNGQNGLYFGLNEPAILSIDAGDQIGLGLSALVEAERLQVLWQPALEVPLDIIAQRLLEAVDRHSVQRLFLDGMDALDDININSERVPLYLTALMRELRDRGVTTVSAVELGSLFGPTADVPIEGVSAIVENIIFLRYVEIRSKLQRIISILKTRRSRHDTSISELKISDQGIEIGDDFTSAEAILTGVARSLPPNS